MTVTAITVSAHGRAVAIELPVHRGDYLRHIAGEIDAELDAIDTITQQDDAGDVATIWFGPRTGRDNPWVTRLADQPINGTVIVTGPTTPAGDLTPLTPRWMNLINEAVRRSGSPTTQPSPVPGSVIAQRPSTG